MIHSASNHPKFKKLKRRLKLPHFAIVGILESIWMIGQTHHHDGGIGRMTDEDISAEIEYDGDPENLIAELLACGWLDRCEINRLVIHDWLDHCPKFVKGILARKTQASRSKVRPLRCDPKGATPKVPPQGCDPSNLIQSNLTPPALPPVEPPQRGGGVTQKISYDPKNAEMPTELDCPEFRQAWADWFEYRRERKLSVYKQKTIELKLRELAELGQAGAIAAIKHSISNAYQGIFEPKPTATTHTNGKTLSPEAQKTRDLFEATKKMILLKPSNDIPIAGPDLGLGFFKTAKTPNPTTEPPKLIADENKAHSDDEPKNELNW